MRSGTVAVDKPFVVVFTGYNQRAVISFVRSLEAIGIDYAIIASSPDDTIFLSKYREQVFVTRKTQDLDINAIIECIFEVQKKKRGRGFFIAPSTESLNRLLLANREKLKSAGGIVPLVEENLYKQISDKQSFTVLCARNGIKVPETYDELRVGEYPLYAKPKQYSADNGEVYCPSVINDATAHKIFNDTYGAQNFFFQQFINGPSYYLLYYFSMGKPVFKYSQRNLVQQPGGKSIIAALSSDLHKSKTSEQYEKLFAEIGFRGMVMIEVKAQDGEYYMIEANPRFWGPSQLFVDAGVNFFYELLVDYGLAERSQIVPHALNASRYFWGGGAKTDQTNTYYGYSEKKLKDEYSAWQAVDIYNRPDTIGIYKLEAGGSK